MRAHGLGLGFRNSGLVLRGLGVWSSGLRAYSLRFRVQQNSSSLWDSGSGVGFRLWTFQGRGFGLYGSGLIDFESRSSQAKRAPSPIENPRFVALADAKWEWGLCVCVECHDAYRSKASRDQGSLKLISCTIVGGSISCHEVY